MPHLGWGAVHGDRSAGGRWTDKEKLQRNNVSELQAAFFALKVFCKEITHAQVKVFSDNTTTVTYIYNMGGNHSLHYWSSYVFYAFPPFSVLGRVVQKIQEDMAEGILLIPNWPTQPWFHKVMRLLVKKLLLPKNNELFQLPYIKTAVHPLVGTGNSSGVSVIRESLQSKGIPPHTLNIIMSSWRESTQR